MDQVGDGRLVRQLRSGPVRFETRAEGEELYIEGYFSVFNGTYQMWEGAAETILPGAFSDTLDGDIRALIDHDTRLVLGRTKAGTLILREDNRGLFGSIRINRQDVDAMNLYARVQRGDVDQCSFGFDILSERYTEDSMTGNVLWSIEKVKLYEVSVVTFPAYEDTAVQARRREYDTILKRRIENWRAAARQRLKGEQKHGA